VEHVSSNRFHVVDPNAYFTLNSPPGRHHVDSALNGVGTRHITH
jgi:hypothetical protein